MSTRFCTSCQSTQDEAGGQYRRLNRTGRWLCRGCAELRTPSIYKTQGKTTAAHLARLKLALVGMRAK